MTCLPPLVKLYCSIKHNKKLCVQIHFYGEKYSVKVYTIQQKKKTEVLLHFVKKIIFQIQDVHYHEMAVSSQLCVYIHMIFDFNFLFLF